MESFSGTSDEQIRINIAQQEYILTVLKSELEGRDRKKGCRALNLILTLCNESFNSMSNNFSVHFTFARSNSDQSLATLIPLVPRAAFGTPAYAPRNGTSSNNGV